MADRDPSLDAARDAEPFYTRVMELVDELGLLKNILPGQQQQQRRQPVIQFQTPAELPDLLPLTLTSTAPPLDDPALLQVCRQVAQLSVATSDFRFQNQQYGGVDRYGLAGALLTECLNTNQHTFEVAPVFVMCEAAVVQRVCRLIGWQQGDGIFSAGGSMAIGYGLALARYRRYPEVKRTGLFGRRPLVLFTSQEAHYSVQKAAHWHGYGLDNVVVVATDENGRMRPDALEAAILRVKEEGKDPLVVNATIGTTVLGAFDPLPDIADVCQRHGLWLHVDACWGGSVLVSDTHRPLMAGVERADSVSWDPHKMLGAPIQCSLFLTQHKGLLHQCNSHSATYLFQQDKFYDVSFDTGDKSIQCGRKADAFKLWLMWKAHGEAGLGRMVDAAFTAARYCGEEVVRRPGFRPVLASPQCTNVGFWYIPESLRGQEETPEWWERVTRVAPRVKEIMVRQGTLMVGYQPLPHKGLGNFFRLVFTAVPEVGKHEVDYVLDKIDLLGRDL